MCVKIARHSRYVLLIINRKSGNRSFACLQARNWLSADLWTDESRFKGSAYRFLKSHPVYTARRKTHWERERDRERSSRCVRCSEIGRRAGSNLPFRQDLMASCHGNTFRYESFCAVLSSLRVLSFFSNNQNANVERAHVRILILRWTGRLRKCVRVKRF